MPILKYTLFVGASLLAIIVATDVFLHPKSLDPTTQVSSSTSSFERLKKMANHGELRPFASAAAAGPFIAMPAAPLPVLASAAIALPDPIKPSASEPALPSSALDAQARVDEPKSIEKPARPMKKVASRKPKPRYVYVENSPREFGGFFGTYQSW